jgi:hypothetical protein
MNIWDHPTVADVHEERNERENHLHTPEGLLYGPNERAEIGMAWVSRLAQ